MRQVMEQIHKVKNAPEEELMTFSREMSASYDLVLEVKKLGKLPVVNFAAGELPLPPMQP